MMHKCLRISFPFASPMHQDDLSSWLKASAENKITTKNAWQSTLIEHFVDAGKFKAQGSVNFQRASSTLEGCMKVYATRVDDVSENTLKLLEMFSKEEDRKKATTRKRSNFIEKNLGNINLRDCESNDFYDPVFSSVLLRADDCLLQDILEHTSTGMHLYTCPTDGIVMGDEGLDIEISILPICDSLKGFESVGQVLERKEEHNEPDFDLDGCMADDADGLEESNEENVMDAQDTDVHVFHETPFGYFKGWAGPYRWKTELNPSKKSVDRKSSKHKFFLDFTHLAGTSALEVRADTILSKDAIISRRRNKNILPDDYSYEIKDLYKYILSDGYFVAPYIQQSENCCNPDIGCEEAQQFVDDPDEMDFSLQFEHSLTLDQDDGEKEKLKFTTVPKRVDIKRLKENVFKAINTQKVTLREIFNEVPSYYSQKEAKDISVHFCLITMLHLANENHLDLVKHGDDILIKAESVQDSQNMGMTANNPAS